MNFKNLNKKIVDTIDLGCELTFFSRYAYRFEENSIYENEESDIIIIFDWELTKNEYFDETTKFIDFLKNNNLESLENSKIESLLKEFYSLKIESSLFESLKKKNILNFGNDNLCLNTDKKIKAIYLYITKYKEIYKELNKIILKLSSDNQFLDEYQQIKLIFNEDDFIYFGDLNRRNLSLHRKKQIDLKTLQITTHPQIQDLANSERIIFKQKEPENYLVLHKNILIQHGINKSVVVLLDLYQLVQSVILRIDQIFNDNVRLYVNNPYVDNSMINTLLDTPEVFHVYHNGISIVCKNYQIGINSLTIEQMSIVNGAQTMFNIIKLIKLGIINIDYLKGKYVLAKLVEVKDVQYENTRLQISQAANTQKAISLQDLKSNHEFLIKYKSLLSHYKIDLLIKRGYRKQFNDNLRIDKFSKIVYSCLFQKPGFARNTSLKKFFDDGESYFIQIFNYNESTLNNNLRVAIVHLYIKCLNSRLTHEHTKNEAIKYMELYQISYIFGKYIIEDYNNFTILLANEYIDINYFNNSFDVYNNDFLDILTKKLDDKYKSSNKFNLFRSDVLYNEIFPENNEVHSRLKRARLISDNYE